MSMIWIWILIVLGAGLLAATAFCIYYHRKVRAEQSLPAFLLRYLFLDYIWFVIRWCPGLLGMALRYVGFRLAGAKLGAGVTIQEGARVTHFRGLTVREYSGIGYEAIINAYGTVTIGKWVRMGPRVSMYTANHNFSRRDTLIKHQGYSYGRIVIGDDVWLGADVLIMPNVTIGNGAVIGAGAVVTKDIPEYAVAVGNPARVLRYRE